jgi:hypothetical protein
MFDTKTSFTGRLTNAVDLLIDFATLGEYGLEPVGRTPERCEARHRGDSEGIGLTTDLPRGPRRSQARVRGVREASGKSLAGGAAWQSHASHAPAA